MTPPSTTLTQLDDEVARSDAHVENKVTHAGDATTTSSRNRVWVSGVERRCIVVAPAPTKILPDVEDAGIDYAAAVDALKRATGADDEIDLPFRSPYRS